MSDKCSIVCLLKSGFTWTSRAGRADLGVSLHKYTQTKMWEPGRPALGRLCVPSATSTAQQGPSCSTSASPGFYKHYLFLRLAPSGAFYPMLLFQDLKNKTQPLQVIFLHLRTSFAASAPSGEVYCNVQVLVYVFVPLKQHKWLKKNPSTDQRGLVVREVGISSEPCSYNQQILQIQMPIWCQTFQKVDYSFWTEMNKELQPSTCDGRVLPHREETTAM